MMAASRISLRWTSHQALQFHARTLRCGLHIYSRGASTTNISTRNRGGLSAATAVAAAAAAGTGMMIAVVVRESCSAQGVSAVGLDDGYAPRTTNPLAVIRKRPALPRVPGEPQYTAEQVSSHNRPGDMWVTYKDGVYNVSDFAQVNNHIYMKRDVCARPCHQVVERAACMPAWPLQVHPGGSKFLHAAAGGPVDTLWAYWHFHHVSTKVEGYLNQYRIGSLSDWQGDDVEGVDMYEADPGGADNNTPLLRSSAQIALFDRPWSSETAVSALEATYHTANDAVYVRNHAPVPSIKLLDHRVTFSTGSYADDALSDVASFSLAELENTYGTKQITSVLQCSGNRAAENMCANGPSGFSGVNYENMKCGMVANVQWGGISLAAVMKGVYPGLQLSPGEETEGPDARYVEFHGADGYYASVPLARVLDDANDCLLATRMNGELLPRDHGFPVRTLLPGIVGARSVKWLERVVIRRGEGDSPWNNYYYKNKSLPLQSDGTFPSCQSLPINSLILSARWTRGDTDRTEAVTVSGIAYSGATGDPITSVEVSGDMGQSWHAMNVIESPDAADASSRHWKWIQWRGTVPVSKQLNSEVCCRAFSQHGANGQPRISPQRGGYLYNGWHRVTPEQH